MAMATYEVFFCVMFAYLSACYQESQNTVTSHANWHLMDHENCGASLTDRIIGGTKAAMGQFPWIARLGYAKKWNNNSVSFRCGGALINNLYVITAAHCVVKLPTNTIMSTIRLGEHNTETKADCEEDFCAPPVQDFAPAQILVHKNYDQPAFRADIALIRLDRPAAINDFVVPICLPYGDLLDKNYTGSSMTVAGWGISSMARPVQSKWLLHVQIPVVPLAKCTTAFRKLADVTYGQMCVGGYEGKDSCGGDSGGPLMKAEVVDGPPKYFLLGLVSFGSKKCGSPIPAVYTDARHYLIWILDNLDP